MTSSEKKKDFASRHFAQGQMAALTADTHRPAGPALSESESNLFAALRD